MIGVVIKRLVLVQKPGKKLDSSLLKINIIPSSKNGPLFEVRFVDLYFDL